jgi:hypothetical protein
MISAFAVIGIIAVIVFAWCLCRIGKDESFNDDCMTNDIPGEVPANIDEVNKTRPKIVPMKHDDDIDWEGVGL